MNLRSLLAATFAGFLAVPMLAQTSSCPMQQARHVDLDVFYGPSQDCGGFTYTVGAVQIGGAQKGCPLYIIVTPPHEVVEPSSHDTRVISIGTSPITMATFICAMDWFLIIPIGSTCTLDRTVVLGTVQLLITIPCNQPPPVAI